MSQSSSKLSLAGKVAIVTGGSRGIGAGIALKLAQEGAKVTLTYTSESSAAKADALVAQIRALNNGADATKVRASLSDAKTIVSVSKEIIDATLKAFNTNTIDILVNNAGGNTPGPLVGVTPEAYDQNFDLNTRAPFFLIQAVHAHLPSNGGGRIISIGSGASRAGFPGTSVYGAAKAALEGITRSAASEFGPEGHTVNVVNAGATKSDAFNEFAAAAPQLVEQFVAQTPLRRLGEAEDIAEVVAWLASDAGRWITGQSLAASGGAQMY